MSGLQLRGIATLNFRHLGYTRGAIGIVAMSPVMDCLYGQGVEVIAANGEVVPSKFAVYPARGLITDDALSHIQFDSAYVALQLKDWDTGEYVSVLDVENWPKLLPRVVGMEHVLPGYRVSREI